jgi:hypothetical protein
MFKACIRISFPIFAFLAGACSARAQTTLVAGWDFGQFVFDGYAITNPTDFAVVSFIPANFSGATGFNPIATHDAAGNPLDSGKGSFTWSQAAADAQQVYGLGAAGSSTANAQMVSFTGTNMSNFFSDPTANALVFDGFSGQSFSINVDLTGFQDFTADATSNFSFAAFADGNSSIEWSVNGASLGTTNVSGSGAYSVFGLDLPASAYGSTAVITATVTGNARLGFDNVQVNGVAITLSAPVISGQPSAPATVIAGSPLALSVQVEPLAAGQLTYQWFKDDAPLPAGPGISGTALDTLTFASLLSDQSGVYKVRVFNGTLFTDSTPVTLVVLTKPAVVREPADLIVNPGQTVVFEAEVTGSAPLEYLWERVGAAFPDASRVQGRDSDTLTLSATTLADAGLYRLTVKNAAGDTVSRSAELRVVEVEIAPTFQVQPTSVTLNEGQGLLLRAEVTGSPAPALRWFKGDIELTDGGRVSGSSTNVLRIAGLLRGDAGSYRVVATNPAGQASSDPALLTVNYVPAFSVDGQPASRSALIGENVVFQVGFDGLPAPTVQWFKDDEALPGQTSATLTLTGVALSDSGSYKAVLTNSAGTAETTPAVLTVNMIPVILPDGQPQPLVLATGASATFTVSATGFPAPSFQWFKGDERIEGATSNRYSIPSVQSSDAGAYRVVVSNSVGSVNSASGRLTVVQSVASRTSAPQTFVPGSNLLLTSYFRDDSGQTSYQWYRNGRRIAGATQSTYLINNAAAADSGTYTVKLIGRYGVYATLTVSKIKVTVAGSFDALLRSTVGLTPAGRVQLSVADNGSYSGNLIYRDGAQYSFKGRFDLTASAYAGTSSVVLRRVSGVPTVELELALDARAGTVDLAYVLNGAESPAAVGIAALRLTTPAAWAARYQLNLAPVPPVAAGQPTATNTLASTIAKNGSMSITGTLADNTKVTGNFPSSTSAAYAVWFNLSSTKGYLGGALNLVEISTGSYAADAAGSGNFVWFRAPNAKAKVFPGGINQTLAPSLTKR